MSTTDHKKLFRTVLELRLENRHLKAHIEALNERIRFAEAAAERERQQNTHGLYVRYLARHAKVRQADIGKWLADLWDERRSQIGAQALYTAKEPE